MKIIKSIGNGYFIVLLKSGVKVIRSSTEILKLKAEYNCS